MTDNCTYNHLHLSDMGVTAQIAAYAPDNGVAEWHIMLHVDPRGELFPEQMRRIYDAEDQLLQTPAFEGAQYVMKRYFLSDSTNQQPLMREEPDVSVSIIQQQPLDGSKIAVWLYLQRGTAIRKEGETVVVGHNGYEHLWRMGMTCTNGGSFSQTMQILEGYEEELRGFNATIEANCVRTWFFVRDVDTQYNGLVVARRENFICEGLTDQTHYIASTGIGGNPAEVKALVQMGAYAIKGIQPAQLRYLYAPTHLNPTYEYGVTFERGTSVEYGDRAHIFISGTASINNKGEVVHVGDVVRQTRRMWENVEKLLEEAEASYDDVMQIIVYLRDTADYTVIQQMFRERFPAIPTVFTLAPVCRPTWLIEMECIAIKQRKHPEFPDF